MPFSKCLRAKIYSNINVNLDPQGCRTLLLKESEPLLLSLGSWTKGISRLMFVAQGVMVGVHHHAPTCYQWIGTLGVPENR